MNLNSTQKRNLRILAIFLVILILWGIWALIQWLYLTITGEVSIDNVETIRYSHRGQIGIIAFLVFGAVWIAALVTFLRLSQQKNFFWVLIIGLILVFVIWPLATPPTLFDPLTGKPLKTITKDGDTVLPPHFKYDPTTGQPVEPISTQTAEAYNRKHPQMPVTNPLDTLTNIAERSLQSPPAPAKTPTPSLPTTTHRLHFGDNKVLASPNKWTALLLMPGESLLSGEWPGHCRLMVNKDPEQVYDVGPGYPPPNLGYHNNNLMVSYMSMEEGDVTGTLHVTNK